MDKGLFWIAYDSLDCFSIQAITQLFNGLDVACCGEIQQFFRDPAQPISIALGNGSVDCRTPRLATISVVISRLAPALSHSCRLQNS